MLFSSLFAKPPLLCNDVVGLTWRNPGAETLDYISYLGFLNLYLFIDFFALAISVISFGTFLSRFVL